ncbi:hypothetical protein RJT34_30481 [Clitoria ternatea]|uniref:Uncharacterized protein n=1 Tax=Clitoria ternatea TaxID=43366 RepID=A0AAN9I435_CLITE
MASMKERWMRLSWSEKKLRRSQGDVTREKNKTRRGGRNLLLNGVDEGEMVETFMVGEEALSQSRRWLRVHRCSEGFPHCKERLYRSSKGFHGRRARKEWKGSEESLEKGFMVEKLKGVRV